MYQLEVKKFLVERMFLPADGWTVNVHIDSMERANGGKHPEGKKERVRDAEDCLRKLGVSIGHDHEFGRADLVARNQEDETCVVEVEGDSRKQKEQALYSALGQTLLQMKEVSKICYGIAFPDNPDWERQLTKIPSFVTRKLNLSLWLVGKDEVRDFNREETRR